MSDKQEKVKEYISLAIDEKVVLKKNYLQTSFNKNLSQNLIIQKADQFIAFKKELDNTIMEKIEEYGDKRELQNPEIKDELVQLIYDVLSDDLKKEMGEILTANQKEFEDINPNLILSEIFLPSKREIENNQQEQPQEQPIESEKSILKISKIRTNFWLEEVQKFNIQKLLAFFEFLQNYGFKMNFQDTNREMVQGALLLAIHSSDQQINSLVWKKFFQQFVHHFTQSFLDDYEAEIDTAIFFMKPHLVLICSYNPDLCAYMEGKEVFENISQHFDNIRKENYALFLQSFVNFLRYYPQSLDKIITLKLVNKIAEKILIEENLQTMALFYMVLNEFSRNGVSPKSYLNEKNTTIILQSLLNLFNKYDSLRVLSFKQRHNISNFKPLTPTDPFLISELFKKTYQVMIEEQCTMREYDQFNQIALFVLQFFSKSHKVIEDDPNQNTYITHVFSLTNMFFYQKETLQHGLYALLKLLNRSNLQLYREELFDTFFIDNIFSVFERQHLDTSVLPAILNFQKLIYMFLETQQLTEKTLKQENQKKIIDFLFRIGMCVNNYYQYFKRQYLGRGIATFLSKFKGDDVKALVFELQSIIAQNTLILQKLSHTHDLDTKVSFDLLRAEKLDLSSVLQNKDIQECNQVLNFFTMIFYTNSKFDRVSRYQDMMEDFTNHTIKQIDNFLKSLKERNKLMDFELMLKVLDLILIVLFFWKTKDEHLDQEFSKSTLTKLSDLICFFYKNCKYFVDLNQNYHQYAVLEQLNLFIHLSSTFDFKFQDSKSWIFLSNLETNTPQLTNKLTQFSEQQIYELINFLGTLLDIKNKCVFINLIVIKQLDQLNNYCEQSEINAKYLHSLVNKALETPFSKQIHQLHPNQFLNISKEMINANLQSFLNFIYRNQLYLNKYVCGKLKQVLSQNEQFDQIPEITEEEKEIMNFTIKGISMKDTQQNVQYLFQMAQNNIQSRILFSDIIQTLRIHFQQNPSENHRKVTLQLLQNTNIFNKLVKLYRKEKLNLSSILKNLLLISKNYDLLKEIVIPERIVMALLKNPNVVEFQEVYTLLFDYIIQKGLYGQLKKEVDVFFFNTKNFLDNKLFFSEKEQYSEVLKSIYYSLKILLHVQTVSKNLTTFDVSEYILKYVFQLFTDNYKLELTPVNNLYLYFNKYFVDDENVAENLKYERKIVKIILIILNQEKKIPEIEEDFYVVSKLLQFCFYVVDVFPFEQFSQLYLQYLTQGLKLKNENAYMVNFYDFYFVLNFKFKAQDSFIEENIQNYLENGKVELSFTSSLKAIEKYKDFSILGYNEFIRHCLTIHYILVNYPRSLNAKEYKYLLVVFNGLYHDSYEHIHKIGKLEKLIIDIFNLILKLTKAVSLKTAQLFLEIFTAKSEFFISSIFDKYIYMGMYNSFFKKPVDKIKWIGESLGVTVLETDKKASFNNLEDFRSHKISQESVNIVSQQLGVKTLQKDKEIILFQFLENVNTFDKEKIQNILITDKAIDLNFEKAIEGLTNLKETKSKQDFDLLIHQIYFIGIVLFQNYQQPDEQKVKKLMDKSLEVFGIVEKNFEILLQENEEDEEIFVSASIKKMILVIIKFLVKLYKFSNYHRQFTNKQKIIDFFAKIYNGQSEIEEQIYLNCCILKRTTRFLQNIYDEVRICKSELIFKILSPLKSPESVIRLKNIEEKLRLELEQQALNQPPQTEKPKLTISQIQEQKKVEEHEQKYPRFLDDYDELSFFEFTMFIYVHVSKNKLLLQDKQKESYFVEMQNNAGTFRQNELLSFLYSKLEQEYLDSGMIYFDPQNSIVEKSKNIFYVHKILETILEKNQASSELSQREIKFINFGLSALNEQILNNVDPDIFAEFPFIAQLAKLFFFKNLTTTHREQISQTFSRFLEINVNEENVKIEDVQEFVEKIPDYVKLEIQFDPHIYFQMATLLIEKVRFEEQFLLNIFNDISKIAFKVNNDLLDPILSDILKISETILLKLKSKENDFGYSVSYIYNFTKDNNRKLKLEQRVLLCSIFVYFRNNTKQIDDLKLKNILKFIPVKFQDQEYNEIKKCLEGFVRIQRQENFHIIYKHVGFELFFKLVVRKYGAKIEIAKTIANLFLAYSEELAKKKQQLFEMFDTLKCFMNNIDYYFILEEKELALIYYKCIVHASRLKANAEYLIQNGLESVLNKCSFINDLEYQIIYTALCFNLSYVFQPGEVDLKEFFTTQTNNNLSLIYDLSLKNDQQDILGEIIDVMCSLIQFELLEFFTPKLIKQIKLTINFYYGNEQVLMRFLNILKILSIKEAGKTSELLIYEFDYLYLYNLHFRNLQNSKVNAQIKQIIYNQLKSKKNKDLENNLVLFGIPENIIHTFSFEDDQDVILINLKLIEYSLKYDRCLFFIKNHFIITLKEIIEGQRENINQVSHDTALQIYYQMYSYFGDIEYLNPSIYFENFQKILTFIQIYENDEPKLMVSVALVLNLIEHDANLIPQISDQTKQQLKNLIKKQSQYKENEKLMAYVVRINDLINMQQQFQDKKYDVYDLSVQLSSEEKQRLDEGIEVQMLLDNKLHKRAKIVFDFIKNEFNITQLMFYDDIFKKDSDKINFRLQNIAHVDKWEKNEMENFESNFKMFFRKGMERGLFFNLKIYVMTQSDLKNRTLYFVFENEFQCSIWKNLFLLLKK